MLQKVSDKTIHQENNHPTPCAGWLNERGMRNIENIGEDCYGFHPDAVFIGDWWEQIMLRKPDLLEDVTYEYFINMAGDLTLLRRARDSPPLPPDVNQLPIEVVEMILSDATVSAEDTLRWLQQVLPVSLINPLIAMSFAGLTYSNLSGATVSMGVLSKPLHSVHWARQIYSFYPQSLKMQEMFWVNQPGRGEWDYIRHETERLATTLACIAMFDSGEFDVEPMRLPGVFALSSGDSIFVATSLTTDPSERPGGPLVKRVLGNLGRPEMAFIVPASNPLLGGCDLASWHMVNHDLFDGSFKDSFKGTSLHLTLTGFEMFLDMGLGGLRDRQVVMLESVISLHDRGKHLGDLDILRSFGHPNLAIGCNCEHHREFDEHGSSPSDDDSSKVSPELHDLVAIDCWDEFFDFPSNTAIIRVCGNWEAQWQRA
jgi:hypothetical protein